MLGGGQMSEDRRKGMWDRRAIVKHGDSADGQVLVSRPERRKDRIPDEEWNRNVEAAFQAATFFGPSSIFAIEEAFRAGLRYRREHANNRS